MAYEDGEYFFTKAPAAYDYTEFGVREVEVTHYLEPHLNSSTTYYRKVFIPKETLSHQIGRYASGLFGLWTPAKFEEFKQSGMVVLG